MKCKTYSPDIQLPANEVCAFLKAGTTMEQKYGGEVTFTYTMSPDAVTIDDVLYRVVFYINENEHGSMVFKAHTGGQIYMAAFEGNVLNYLQEFQEELRKGLFE